MIAAWCTLLACAGIQGASAGLTVEYLVVAGGGGGGSGGGGAGGVLQDSVEILPGSVWEVVVGAGGIGGYGGSPFNRPPDPVQSTSGGNSILGPIVSFGGGFGAGNSRVPGNGGSGGGGGFDRPNISPGRGTPGQGNDGGISDRGGFGAGGGGGGAGQAGSNAPAIHLGGNGGDGVESNITGTVQWFGGGGGGGVNINNGQVLPNGGGTGGLGGGGNGSSFGVPVGGSREGCFNGQSGLNNTGGGGGGTDPECDVAGDGGSGLVVLRYRSAEPILIGGNVTSLDGYILHSFMEVGASSLVYPFDCNCQKIPVNGPQFRQCNYWGDPHYTASWGPHGRFDYQGLGVHEVVNNSENCQSFRMQAFHCQYRRTSNAVTLGVAFLLDNNTRVFMNDSFVSVTPGGEGRVTVSGPLTNAQLSSGVDIQTGDNCNFASINGVRIRGKPGYILNAQIRAHEEVDAPQGICGTEFLVSTFVSDSADYLFTDEEFVDMCNHCESFGGTGSPGCPGVTTTTAVPVSLSDRCSFARPGVNANIPGTLSNLEECQISSGTSPFDEYVQKQPTANLSSFDDVCVFYYDSSPDSSSGIKNCNAVCSLLGTTCNAFLGRVGVGASGSCATATSDFSNCVSEPVGEAICACNINQDFIPNAGESIQDIVAAAQADPNINFEDAVGNCSTGWLEGVVLPANLSNTSIPLTVEQFNVLSCVADWVFAEPEDRVAIVEITQEQDPVIPPNQCQGTDGAQLEAPSNYPCLCAGIGGAVCTSGQFCSTSPNSTCLISCANFSCTVGQLRPNASEIPCAESGCTDSTCCETTTTTTTVTTNTATTAAPTTTTTVAPTTTTTPAPTTTTTAPATTSTTALRTTTTTTAAPTTTTTAAATTSATITTTAAPATTSTTAAVTTTSTATAAPATTTTAGPTTTTAAAPTTSTPGSTPPPPATTTTVGTTTAPGLTCADFQCPARFRERPYPAERHCKPEGCDVHTCCRRKRFLRRRRRHRNPYHYNTYYGSALEIEGDEDDFEDMEEGAFLQDPWCEEDDDTCEDELLELEDHDAEL